MRGFPSALSMFSSQEIIFSDVVSPKRNHSGVLAEVILDYNDESFSVWRSEEWSNYVNSNLGPSGGGTACTGTDSDLADYPEAWHAAHISSQYGQYVGTSSSSSTVLWVFFSSFRFQGILHQLGERRRVYHSTIFSQNLGLITSICGYFLIWWRQRLVVLYLSQNSIVQRVFSFLNQVFVSFFCFLRSIDLSGNNLTVSLAALFGGLERLGIGVRPYRVGQKSLRYLEWP